MPRELRVRLTPALLAILAVATPAHAQRATEGVVAPFGDLAAGDHVDATEINPAGIGFGESFELSYAYVASGDRDHRGDGHALFLGLGALDPYHPSLGLQWLDPPGEQSTLPMKVTWAHALRLSPAVTMGFAWHTFHADDPGLLDDVSSFDFGVQLRPVRWMAVGATVTDFTAPSVTPRAPAGVTPDALRLERGFGLGLAIRPGTERVTLGVQGSVLEDGDMATVGGRLVARLFGALALTARYEALDARDEPVQRVLIGLSDEGLAGVGLFGYAPDVGEDGGNTGIAVTGRLRTRAEETPTLFRRPTVVEVEIGDVAEYTTRGFFNPKPQAPFLTLLRTLRRLARHDEVDAVLLGFGDADLGWAQAAEIRDAIALLRRSGKVVYAYVPVGDTRAYAVAAAADHVYTTHAGGLLLTGLHAELLHLGALLEKLGVRAEFVTTGAYKSAPELFTRQDASPAATQVQNALMDDLYGRVVGHIAEGRGLSPEQVRTIIDAGPYTAQAAKEAGLVDGVVFYDEFEQIMKTAYGPRVRFTDARSLLDRRDARWGVQPTIGVLYAVGNITDGESVANPFTGVASTGAQTFVRAVEQLRLDGDVAAVVLRVDSPGGSVTASDLMWRALTRLAQEKPLIVSMGDIAASGGYYVAAPGAEILASPETITGSIGVFTGKFDLTGLYGHIGVDKTQFTRGKRAALLSEAVPWTDDERQVVQKAMDALYDLFLERVAAGRPKLRKDQVEPLAGGRVWTGAQAQACGLVDRAAGLLTAIDVAAAQARVGDDEYTLRVFPAPSSAFGGLPTAPVHSLGAALLGAPAGPPDWARALLAVPALRAAASLPLLQYPSGTPLALLPFAPAPR